MSSFSEAGPIEENSSTVDNLTSIDVPGATGGDQQYAADDSINLPSKAGLSSVATTATSTPVITTTHTEVAQTTLAPDGVTQCPTVEMKLFVGCVPRHIDEAALKPIFEEFGSVKEVIIIKDKATGAHKGSAFIRMASITQSDACVRSLHNIKVMDSNVGPLQVRYATGEAEKLGLLNDGAIAGQDEAKLFVGSIPKSVTEDEVRNTFEKFGAISEVFVMKDMSTGVGRGCAFVKFNYKEQALNAIEKLNQKYTMSGSTRPMEVRFAEHKKSMGNVTNNVAVPQMGGAGGGGGGLGGRPMSSTPALSNQNPRQIGQWKEYFSTDGRPYYHSDLTGITQWDTPIEFQYLNSAGGGSMPTNKSATDPTGPPGANVFIFHVPNDWSNAELTNAFSQFGHVISAHIATDKSTGRNRGFAFVSYDDLKSAAAAVTHMNGFMVHGKRLKVSIKSGEETYVRHLLPPGGAAGAGQAAAQGMGGQMPQMGMGSMLGTQMAGQSAALSNQQAMPTNAASGGYAGYTAYAAPHGQRYAPY